MNNPTEEFTSQLQKAYVKAGEDMGKQMAASIVAIVTEMTAGQGQPSFFGWSIEDAPLNLLGILPTNKTENAQWVILTSEATEKIPFVETSPLWIGHLTSGHTILLL